MDLIDSLGKRIDNVMKQVGNKSTELLNIGRINFEILKEQEAIRKLYREIGEAVFDAYSTNGDYTGVADAHCSEIEYKINRINELRNKIEEIKKANARNKNDDGSSEDEEANASYVNDITDADDESYSPSVDESADNKEICPHCGGILKHN